MSVYVGFVANKVALGQGFLRVTQFSSVNIIPSWLSKLIYAVQTYSLPIDMNNNKGYKTTILNACKTWSLIQWDEQRVRIFVNC